MADTLIDSPPTAEPDLRAMVALCHHRWSIPVIAALGAAGGAKFVTLANKLGVSRDALSRTLAALDSQDLAMRNPGYGHPMRPEYLLTPDGERVAPACAALVARIARLDAQDACWAKWGLPVLAALAGGARRFTDLRAALPPVTPRALTQTLDRLCASALVRRRVEADERPPRVSYSLHARARPLAHDARALAGRLSATEV